MHPAFEKLYAFGRPLRVGFAPETWSRDPYLKGMLAIFPELLCVPLYDDPEPVRSVLRRGWS